MTNQQIASTILAQLGGNRFLAMTGAKSLTYGDKQLTFRLPATRGYVKNKAKAVRITLTDRDLYDVEFIGMRKFDVFTISKFDGVDCEQLAPIFEAETGLYTKL